MHPNHANMQHQGASEALGALAQALPCLADFGVRPETLWPASHQLLAPMA